MDDKKHPDPNLIDPTFDDSDPEPEDDVLDPDPRDEAPEETLDPSLAIIIGAAHYKLRATNWVYSLTKKTRKHMIKFDYTIVGAFDARHERFVGRTVRDFVVLTQDNVERLVALARETGAELPRTVNRASAEAFATQILRAESITAYIESETWRGRTRAVVESYGAPTSAKGSSTGRQP